MSQHALEVLRPARRVVECERFLCDSEPWAVVDGSALCFEDAVAEFTYNLRVLYHAPLIASGAAP